MNVHLESLPHCLTTMRVEVPAEKVAATRDTIARDYSRQVRLPGYRPGKAPRTIVEAKFKKEIREELQKRLLSESCREAITEKKLRVLSLAEVEDVEIAPDDTMRFTATLVTAPEFELPEYKNIALTEPSLEVSEEEIERALDNLREQAATFTDITDRPLALEDFAVLNYTGLLDGVPINEAVPQAGKPLGSGTDFWLRMTPEAFFPGFAEQLVGANPGETREFPIAVPAEFGISELAGKTLQYTVTLNLIKAKQLPEWTDELAATVVPGKTVAEIRELVGAELRTQKRHDADRERKNQVMKHLLDQVECELPQDMVRQETKRILNELVRENQGRGVADELLKENEKELVGVAAQSARDRLKGTFILLRIAEQEKMAVTRAEFAERLSVLAARYGMPRAQLVKELEDRGANDQVREEILTGKVLEFLSNPPAPLDEPELAAAEA